MEGQIGGWGLGLWSGDMNWDKVHYYTWCNCYEWLRSAAILHIDLNLNWIIKLKKKVKKWK